jgi:hypothetical protein
MWSSISSAVEQSRQTTSREAVRSPEALPERKPRMELHFERGEGMPRVGSSDGEGDGEPGASRWRAHELRGGGASVPEKNKVATELRGKAGGSGGLAEELRGGRGREAAARAPRAAAVGGLAGGGCGGGVDLKCGGGVACLRPRFRWGGGVVHLILFTSQLMLLPALSDSCRNSLWATRREKMAREFFF